MVMRCDGSYIYPRSALKSTLGSRSSSRCSCEDSSVYGAQTDASATRGYHKERSEILKMRICALLSKNIVLAPHNRLFNRVFERAQSKLRDTFGMELVELPSRVVEEQSNEAGPSTQAGAEDSLTQARKATGMKKKCQSNVLRLGQGLTCLQLRPRAQRATF